MQVRKQYSIMYQVLELLQEVPDDDVEKQYEVSKHFDNFARTELKSMLDVINEISPSNPTQGTVAVVSKPTGKTISDKQAGTIKRQFARCKQLASELGIVLNSENDVDNLTSADGSKIIQAMFGNKSTTGF